MDDFVSCENCFDAEGTEHHHVTGWVCQPCRDDLESDDLWREENECQPSEHDEWMSFDEDC